MIKISIYKLIFLTTFVCIAAFPPATQAAQCKSLAAALEESTAADWGQLPPSLKPLLFANLSLLLGVEGVRGLSGWDDAFSPQFFVNTPLDSTLTVIAHTIAIGRAPAWLKNLTSGRLGYFARATTNTLINTLVILAFWKSAAIAQGKTITPLEAGSALGLCTAFYFCVQYIKNRLFVELPRRFDLKQMKEIEAFFEKFYGGSFTEIIKIAQERGGKFELSKEEVELLFVSTMDRLVLSIPYEQRIMADDQAPASWRQLAEQIQAATKESQREKLRRKLIWKLLDDSDLNSPLFAQAQAYLDLGAPLTPQQSMNIHHGLKSRYWRNKVLVSTGAAADQMVGVVLAGGFLLRGLTEQALAQ